MKWLLALSLAEVLTMTTFANYSAALPVLRRDWTLTATEAGTIFAAQQLGYTAAVLVLSSLTDVVGVRAIYLASAVWNGVFGLLFAWLADGFWSAAILRGLGGIGLAGTYVPGMRLVVERFQAGRRGAAMGVYIACFSLGASLSLLLTGLILPFGWSLAFAATAVGPLLAFAVAWPIVRDASRPSEIRSVDLRSVFRNVRARRLIAAYAAHNWELFGMRAWLPAFLTVLWTNQGIALPIATARGANFGSLVLLAGALSNAVGGWLSDHLGRRRTILIFLSASALCSAVMGWSLPLGAGSVLSLAIIYGALVTAESSTLSTAVAESAHPHALGATLALQSSFGFLVTAISPALFGIVLDATHASWGLAFLSLGVAALIGVIAVATLR